MINLDSIPDLAPDLGVQMKVVSVTPDLAKLWLADNTSNRREKKKKQAEYASDMRSGNWALDGSPIRFSKSGRLLDGQNRLKAIVSTGVTVTSVVITGLSEHSQTVMDTAASRTVYDSLTMSGEKNAVRAAATVGFVLRWERGARAGVSQQGTLEKAAPTKTEQLDYYWAHRDEIQNSIACSRKAVERVPPKSISGANLSGLFVILSRIDYEDAEGFFGLLAADPAELPGADHPVAALRRVLVNQTIVAKKRPEKYVIAMFIKAWNAYRDGEPVQALRFSPGGAHPEKFPEPR